MKAQVSVIYDGLVPQAIETIVVSQQHDEGLETVITDLVQENIIQPVLAQYCQYNTGPITYHINPTGRFVQGGPYGDTGLTGRKIIVDTYGGMCPHGGGAFSGKDPTKVDRSAAYMARYVAKNIVAADLADRVMVALAYAIGVAEPVAINIETYGTGRVDEDEIEKRVRANFGLTPAAIIKELDLLNTAYLPTARNGHFGNAAFPWEGTAKASVLRG
jgi:S-adenosylmethionine synthetase